MSNDDVSVATTPNAARVGGLLLVLAGAVGLLYLAQLYGFLSLSALPAPSWVMLGVIALCSTAALVFGVGYSRARRWALGPAAATAFVLWATSGIWSLVAFAGGYVSMFGFMLPSASMTAGILIIVTYKGCRRAAEARERLASEGLDLGV